MNGPARNWLPILHPDDRDRFKLTLDTIIEHRRGRIHQDFRVRDADGHYHWLALRARLEPAAHLVQVVGFAHVDEVAHGGPLSPGGGGPGLPPRS